MYKGLKRVKIAKQLKQAWISLYKLGTELNYHDNFRERQPALYKLILKKKQKKNQFTKRCKKNEALTTWFLTKTKKSSIAP